MAILLKNKWEIAYEIDKNQTATLLETVLNMRGLDKQKDMKSFLQPDFEITHDPFLFIDMHKACDLIISAIEKKEQIVVFGDYDVDGITSTAIMILFLNKLGAITEFVIPDRILEGYGLTMNGVQKLINLKSQLVITVDCGISSISEVQILIDNNIKVVLTDHHECKKTLPNATAVLNPKRPGNIYPFPYLAGVGVAFKLIQAICIRMNLGDLWKSFIDLVALGTVADVVPLCGENRMIVYYGLDKMNKSQNIGLKSLLDAIDKKDKEITATTIGYGIAPRINAAGRMGDSNRAVRLLTTFDQEESLNLANDLISDNKKRQEVEAEIFEMAKEQVKAKNDYGSNEIIVVYQKGWHQGVIGIVASRLVELFNRSVIILGGEDNYYKGSARAANNESILSAIEFASEYVERFGGHKKAAGIVVDEDKMEHFIKAIKEYSMLQPDVDFEGNTIKIDCEILFDQISLINAHEISKMAPFGEGNPQPLFVSRNLIVEKIRFLSGGKHMKLSLTFPHSGNKKVDAIAFGYLEENSNLKAGDTVDVVFLLDQNEWNGTKSVQIMIKDIRKSVLSDYLKYNELEDLYQKNTSEILAAIKKIKGISNMQAINSSQTIAIDAKATKSTKEISTMNLDNLMNYFKNSDDFSEKLLLDLYEIIPQSSEFGKVYQYIKSNYSIDCVICDLDILADNIYRNYRISISVFKLARIFDIFMEAGLMTIKIIGRYRLKFQLLDVAVKVSLSDSKTFQMLCKESVI